MTNQKPARRFGFFLLCAGCAASTLAQQPADKPAAKTEPAAKTANPRVEWEIVQGDKSWGKIVIELDEAKAPLTAKNFLRYTDEGYYDGTVFHRVISGPGARIQVVQGGGWKNLKEEKKEGLHEPIKNEANNGLKNVRGTIAMAREEAPDTAVNEFFINTGDNPKLDYTGPDHWGYCVFGKVVEGMDVIDKIAAVEKQDNPTPPIPGEKMTQPVNPPLIKKAKRIGGK